MPPKPFCKPNWANQSPVRTIRAGVFAFAFCLLFAALFGRQAHSDGSPKPPKTIALLTSGLTWEDTKNRGPLQDLRVLLEQNGVGVALLNPAVSGEATEAAAFLSVGAGERMAVPDTTGPVLYEAGIARTVSDMAQEVYTLQREEGRVARVTYRRRMGFDPPTNAAVVHVGVGPLLRAQPTEGRKEQIGALGSVLQKAGRRITVWGDWRAVLVGMDKNGVVPYGTTLDEFQSETLNRRLKTVLPQKLKQTDVLVIGTDDVRVFRVFARALIPLAKNGTVNVLLASVAPPLNGDDKKWDALGFVAGVGPYFRRPNTTAASSLLLVSPTTRTPGLVANVDIAATICAMQSARATTLGGAGRAIVPAQTAANPFAAVDKFDKQVRATTTATVPVLVGWGLFAFTGSFLALVAATVRARWLADVAQVCLLIAASTFVALLPVGVIAPPTPAGYAMLTLLLSAAVSFFAFVGGIALRRPAIGLVFALTTLVIVADALFGSPLVSRSVLSGYYLAGIRFYGLGNEYLGILIGSALCAVPSLFPQTPTSRRPQLLWALAAVALTLLIGLPNFGADAGGALAGTVGFVCAFFALRDKLRLRHVAIAFALAFVVVALLAAWDAARPGSERSHIGQAAAMGTHQAHGLQRLFSLVWGKLAMNARLTAAPFTLAALALFVPLFGWLRAGRVGQTLQTALAARPVLARFVPAVLWGTFAAFAFNDSGIVAALLILACLAATLLDAVCETIIGSDK